MRSYSEFFEKATGFAPYPYQSRLAADADLPSLLSIPTGLGKTAATVLAWLWRRRFADDSVRKVTPRRLVYCLPMRVLVEQTVGEVDRWLKKLGLDDVELHMLLGGAVAKDWDLHPERDAVIVGTQDMILSRALNRGYAMSRFRWPVQFGLLNNDALWVMDEVQLMGSGLATTAQLQAFRRKLGTVLPCLSIWMSATMRREWLTTVDFAETNGGLGELAINQDDREFGAVQARLTAAKQLEMAPLPASAGGKAEAALIIKAHRPGDRTLVVVNTVKRATAIFVALQKTKGIEADVILLHSRFRPGDRRSALSRLLEAPGTAGSITVSTQVVEAGVDVSARTLFTDLAPWPSLAQRFGRCNRAGEFDDAAVVWFDKELDGKGKAAAPYSNEELDHAREKLLNLQDAAPATLPVVDTEILPNHVIRLRDIIELFDTTPDLAGADIDVSRFIREADEYSAQVFWRTFGGDKPMPNEPAPDQEELCSAPLGEIREFLKKHPRAWRWDHLEKVWMSLRSPGPGQVIMLKADDGGYVESTGWTPSSPRPVGMVEAVPDAEASGYDDDFRAKRSWKTLAEHTDAVVEAMEQVLDGLPGLCDESRQSLRLAARWHDAGKTHPVFQGAMIPDEDGGGPDQLWAKAPKWRRYTRPGFRHEFASALAMLAHGLPDLAAYLAAAHHGKVRVSVRSLPHEKPPGDSQRRFARGVWDGDTLPAADLGGGVALSQTHLDLSCLELGDGPSGPSWLARSLALRDEPELGPFRLAYLEALLRVADWRASEPVEVQHA